MHEMHTQLNLVKQMMEERQREAAKDALRERHSRAGQLARFLDRIADRIDPTGEARRRRLDSGR